MPVAHRHPSAEKHVLQSGAAILHSCKIADLRDRNQRPRARHKSDYHGFRNVAGQVTQLEHCDQNLYATNHDSEKEHGLVRFHVRAGAEKCQRAENDERDRVGWPVDEVGRRAENRGHQRNDDRGVKAETGIHARDQGVSHGLGQGNGRHGDTRQQVFARFIG